MKKPVIITIGIILIIAIIIAGIYWRSSSEVNVKAPAITGEVACLPLKNPDEGVNDAMCMKGLKNKAGLYLEVQTMTQEQLELGKTIEVKGEITPPNENSKYQTAGTIVQK